MTIYLYQNDLPDNVDLGKSVAIDTEAMGLNPHRDRLCLVQMSSGDGHAHLVQFTGIYNAPNLTKLLTDSATLKIFHFARFDLAIMREYLGVDTNNIYCTKTASRLCRTFTDRHGLKELVREVIGTDINKNQQTSDWGSHNLSEEQKSYAANDVLFLHQIKQKLDIMLEREGRTEMAQRCMDFLMTRANLDLQGWQDFDIFAH